MGRRDVRDMLRMRLLVHMLGGHSIIPPRRLWLIRIHIIISAP